MCGLRSSAFIYLVWSDNPQSIPDFVFLPKWGFFSKSHWVSTAGDYLETQTCKFAYVLVLHYYRNYIKKCSSWVPVVHLDPAAVLRDILTKLSQEHHILQLIRSWIAEETGLGEKPRHTSTQRNSPDPPWGPWDVSRPNKIYLQNLQQVLGLPRGLFPVERAQKTSKSSHPGSIRTRTTQTTSTDSFQCEGAAALPRAPPGRRSSSFYL